MLHAAISLLSPISTSSFPLLPFPPSSSLSTVIRGSSLGDSSASEAGAASSSLSGSTSSLSLSSSSSSTTSRLMDSWTPYPWSSFIHTLNSLNSSSSASHSSQQGWVSDAHGGDVSGSSSSPSLSSSSSDIPFNPVTVTPFAPYSSSSSSYPLSLSSSLPSLSPSSIFSAASSFLFTPEPSASPLSSASTLTSDRYFSLLNEDAVPGASSASLDDSSDMLEEFIGFLNPESSHHPLLHEAASASPYFLTDDASLLIDPTISSASSDSFLAVSVLEALAIAIPALIIMLFTIIGNALVIVAVFTYRPLKQSPNMYLVSLAFADITVAMFVMPFNVIYSIRGKWDFGLDTCKAWLTFDILCCTASILNLCAIALDRYQAIHDPINYAQKRTLRRVLIGVLLVWIISALISIPPLLGWNDWPETFSSSSPCTLTSEKGFVVYSSSGSFFIPLFIMSIVYVKIFLATRRRLRARTKSAAALSSQPTAVSTMSNAKSATNLWNPASRRDGSIDHSDPTREEERTEMHQFLLHKQKQKQQQQQHPPKKKKSSSAKFGTAAASFMTTITSRLDTSSSSKTSPEAPSVATWTPSVLAVAASCSNSNINGMTAAAASSHHQQQHSDGVVGDSTAAEITGAGSGIDHCPVSPIVRIAIEKNSSSISSSQDDFTLLMPPDLMQQQSQSQPAATYDERNGFTDGSTINGSIHSSKRIVAHHVVSSFSVKASPLTAAAGSSSSHRDNDDDDDTTAAAATAIRMDGSLREDRDGIVLVNQSEKEETKVRRSHGTDGREEEDDENDEGHGPVADSNGRELPNGSNQITESGTAAGYTEIDIEDGIEGRESTHHKRIIDSAFNEDPMHKEAKEGEVSGRKDGQETGGRKRGTLRFSEANDATKVRMMLADASDAEAGSVAVASSSSSGVTFDRTHDGENHDRDEGTEMICTMDQSVTTRLSVPGVSPSLSQSTTTTSKLSSIAASAAVKDVIRRKESSSTSSGTSPCASSPSSFLLLHPNRSVRKQSNLENNLTIHQQQSSSKHDCEAPDPGTTSSLSATTTAAASCRRDRSKLKVEYESSCGSSGPTIDPISTGTNAGSASVAQVWEEKQRISLSRERKAARVLGIVMGVFVACWLPFFLMYVILPFAEQGIPRWLENLITWLGYINSALNPIIYTIFNLDFRRAFQKILTCDRR